MATEQVKCKCGKMFSDILNLEKCFDCREREEKEKEIYTENDIDKINNDFNFISSQIK